MINLKRLIFFICASLLCCVQCRKDTIHLYETPKDFDQVFEDFWNKMNINYVYWDIESTNWDEVYRFYKPLFKQLNIAEPADINTAISYFRQMTSGLTDGHYFIDFINTSPQQSAYPSLNRKITSGNFHSAFRYTDIDTAYLDAGSYSGYYITSDQKRVSVLYGTIHHTILYFHCDNFALQEAWQSPVSNSVKTVLLDFFNRLQDASVKGVIIDVRNNAGGNINDLNFLVGHLTDQPLHFGYARYKNGNGRLAYTPWINATIVPQAGSTAVKYPVIVLADNFSASLAEAVAMAVKVLPNSFFVGETTWGATGPITSNEVYHDGPFTVTGFMSVKTSSAEFKYIDGKMYEGKGFTPDVTVPFNLTALQSGDDKILDTALSLIR